MSKKVRIKFSADFGFSSKFYEKKLKNTRKTWKSTESFLDKKTTIASSNYCTKTVRKQPIWYLDNIQYYFLALLIRLH